MKNWLIDLSLKINAFFPKNGEEPQRFLIISTTGLGDSLWATPAISALRNRYKEAYIALLTSPVGYEVFENSPHIDELFLLRDPLAFFKLRRRKITTALLFHASQRIALPLCHLIGATKIVGTRGLNKDLDHLLTDPLEKKRVHEIQRRVEIVERVGAVATQPMLEFYLEESDKCHASDFLLKHKIPSHFPLVGLHPGAKDRFKQWHPNHFIALGNQLVNHLGCQILVTGNSSEFELMAHIAKNIPGAFALTEKLPLRTVAALIKKMQLMVSNDTGPMHLAFAMQTPTVALFGPTDPKLCGPLFSTNCKVISKPVTCSPCLKKRCRQPFCLLQISPQEVYDAALELFYAEPNLHHRSL